MRTVFGKRGNETACCILAGSSENLLLGLFISLSKNFPFILPGITSCAVLYVFMLPVHSQFSLGCSLTDELQVGFPVGCSLSAVDIPPSSLLRSPGPPHSHFMSCRNVVNASLTAAPVSQQAIESFALTVKEIAQMLQCFGTELAETELPEDIFSIERILALRTERYCQLKVWLSKALHSHLGSLLLALPAAHSSLPAVCVCVCLCALSDKVELPVRLPCLEQITLPAHSELSELPAPSCLQSLSGACFAHLAVRRALGGSVSCLVTSPGGIPSA